MSMARVGVWGGLVLGMAAGGDDARAQIATDGRLTGSPVTLSGPHFAIGAELGRQVGGNLFHSFANFNLATGQSATFSGPGSVANIVSRVTGGTASSIDGTLRSTIAGANLFLVNPQGILFGPSARLDLSGSFYASTANYLRLADGGRFDASNPAADVLTAAPPAAFGFLGPSPAAIQVQASALSLPEGKSLAFVGGPIAVRDATISTVAGDVRLVAMGAAGEVPLVAAPLPPSLAAAVVERSTLTTQSGAASPPGRILIRGGSITIEGSALTSRNETDADAPAIDVQARDNLLVRASLVESYAAAAGRGADLVFGAHELRIEPLTTFGTQASGAGDGGDIRLSASATLSAFSTAADGDYNYLYTSASGAGSSGDIRLAADRIDFRAPYTFTETRGAGDAGAIRFEARDMSLIEGTYIRSDGYPGSSGRTSAIELIAGERIHLGGLDPFGFKAEILTLPQGSGHAQPIVVRARDVLIKGANIESATFSGSANAGDVRVSGETVRFIAGDGAHARAASIAFGSSSGDGGNLEVVATRAFELNGNGFLHDWTHFVTATEGSGRGGEIIIKAPSVLIDRGTLFARTRFGTGAPGGIRIDADTVTLRNEGGIGSHTEGSRKGAAVVIRARVLDLSDTSGVNSNAASSGDAGSLRIEAEHVRLTGASSITASSHGGSRAGDIVLEVSRLFEMVDRAVGTYQDLGGGGPRGSDVWPGGIDLAATLTGSGGSLLLRAPTIVLDEARIRSSAHDSGQGGRVQIRADQMIMRNGAQIDARTAPGSSGDAGAIDIVVSGRFEISGLSRIDGGFSGLYAQTQGSGRGGSIDLVADTLVLERGLIRSSTSGSGNAGTIRIRAGDVRVTSGGWIDAGTTAASTGAGGNIDIQASRSLAVTGIDRAPIVALGAPPRVPATHLGSSGRDQGGFFSTLGSSAAGGGAGGNVTLSAPQITIADGARVSANSSGSGDAGSIVITASDRLGLYGGSITTQAEASDGGNIDIRAGNMIRLIGAEISTSVGGGQGSGGNIFIDPTFVILESSRLSADAVGGAGGNVSVFADVFLASPDSVLSASSQLGLPGSVQVSALQSGVLSVLPALPGQFLDASRLLREACTPRAAGSRLVNVGRGGVAAWSPGYSPSSYFGDAPFGAATTSLPPLASAASPTLASPVAACRS